MTRILAILLIFTTMLSFSGCGLVGIRKLVEKDVMPRKDSNLPQPDLNPTHWDAILAINAAYKRLCEARSYRLKTMETDSSGKPNVGITEFMAPDRHRVVLRPGTDGELESIVIGKRAYSRFKGKWIEAPNPYARDDVDPFTKCTLEHGAPKLPGLPETEVKLIRQEVLDGVEVLTYRSTTDFQGTQGPDSFVVTHSIGAKDGLIYRRETVTSKDESLKTTAVSVFSDYNADIGIESPI